MRKTVLAAMAAVFMFGTVCAEGAEYSSPYAEIELRGGSSQAVYTLDGENGTIDFGGEAVYIDENGKYMFPLRAVKDVFMDDTIVTDWYADSKTAVLRRDSSKSTFLLRVSADSDMSAVCGTETKMDMPAIIKNDQMFVGLYYIADALSAEIISEDSAGAKIKADTRLYTEEELRAASDILSENRDRLEIKAIYANYPLNYLDVTVYDTSTADVEEMKELCGVYRIRVSYVEKETRDIDD